MNVDRQYLTQRIKLFCKTLKKNSVRSREIHLHCYKIHVVSQIWHESNCIFFWGAIFYSFQIPEDCHWCWGCFANIFELIIFMLAFQVIWQQISRISTSRVILIFLLVLYYSSLFYDIFINYKIIHDKMNCSNIQNVREIF